MNWWKPHQVEREKEALEKFMRFWLRCCVQAARSRILTDLIDPRTYPLSRVQEKSHDDTAVVKALLGFPVIHNKMCTRAS